MHRFTKSLKKNLCLLRDAQLFYSYCFSLLLNCTSFEMMQNYFQSILVVALSESKTNEFEKEFKNLQTLISSRPDQDDYKKLVESYITSDEMNETLNRIYAEKKLEQPIVNRKEQKKTLKETSPFMKHFNHMVDKVKKFDNIEELNDHNSLYSPEFITFLMDKYLPYCYIWSSFGFSGLSFSRITNGIVEKYNEFRKSDTPSDLLPHIYVSKSKDLVRGNCVDFMKKSVTKKIKKPSASESSSDEENYLKALEGWDKKRKIPISKPTGFQAASNFVLIDKKNEVVSNTNAAKKQRITDKKLKPIPVSKFVDLTRSIIKNSGLKEIDISSSEISLVNFPSTGIT